MLKSLEIKSADRQQAVAEWEDHICASAGGKLPPPAAFPCIDKTILGVWLCVILACILSALIAWGGSPRLRRLNRTCWASRNTQVNVAVADKRGRLADLDRLHELQPVPSAAIDQVVEDLLRNGQYQAAMDSFRSWQVLPDADMKSAARCVTLFFAEAVTLYPGGLPSSPHAKYAVQIYRLLVGAFPAAVSQFDVTTAATLGQARLVLAHRLNHPPTGSPAALAELNEAVIYYGQLIRRYPALANGSEGFRTLRGQIRFLLGRNLIVAHEFRAAALAFEQAVRDQRSKQFLSPRYADELFTEMAEASVLMLALPDEEGSHRRAAQLVAEAAQHSERAQVLIAKAAVHYRHGRYRLAEDQLQAARYRQAGANGATWLWLALALLEQDRPQAARKWLDLARMGVDSERIDSPWNLAQHLLLGEAELRWQSRPVRPSE